MTVRSVDWQTPKNTRNWRWNDTDVSVLVYDTASKGFVDVLYFWNSTAKSWRLPRTNSHFNVVPWPGWKMKFGSSASYLVTNGSVILERLGPALSNPTSETPTRDKATNLFTDNTLGVGFLFNPSSYRGADFKTNIAIYPGRYSLSAWTYGYVQDGIYLLGDLGKVSVTVPKIAAQADSIIQVMSGLTFNITVNFRKEGIFDGIPCNSSVRIRVYDNSDRLVAAASTSLDPGAKISDSGFFFNSSTREGKISSAGGTIGIPAGTRILEYRNLAGLYRYTELLTGRERAEAVKRSQLFSADYGVWGSVGTDRGYRGGWLVKIDLVNWYLPEIFHPAPPALLQGESTFLFSFNHLGPYESRSRILIPNAAIGGCASIVIALDLRAYVRGSVYLYNWFEEVRTSSWVAVELSKGKESYRTHSFDGYYDAYLTQGTYEIRVSQRTLTGKKMTISRTVVLSDGASDLGQDFFFESI